MKRIIRILSMSHNIFVLNFWSIVDKKALPVSGATMGTDHHRPHHFTVKVTRDGKEKNSAPSLGSQFLLRPYRSAALPIDVAMNYR